MGQPITKIRFSVGTKLLLSVLALLVLVIFFLNFSAIVILKRDKVAYTYQMQSVEAQMIGVEFKNLASKSIEIMKIALGTINPKQPVTQTQRQALESLVKNQDIVTVLTVKLLDVTWSRALTLVTEVNPTAVERLQLKDENLSLDQRWIESQLPQILAHGVVFFSRTRVGSPLMGILVADLKYKDDPAGIPIAIGYISLDQLSERNVSSKVTVADRMGWVLYDNNPDRMYGGINIREEALFLAARNSQVNQGALELRETDEKDYLGSYIKLDNGLTVLSKTELTSALRGTYTLTERFILLGAIAIGAGILFSILFAKRLTSPLASLYQATQEVAAGNFNLSLGVRSRDELGALSSSFNVMSEKIRGLIASSVESVKVENELAIASVVQQTLIPPSNYEDENVVIRSYYQSATTCGGDWWGFIRVGKKMSVMIADATGHGFPSALITAAARSCFSVLERLSDEYPDLVASPRKMLSYANRSVYDSSKGQIMMTFFAGVIDFERRTLTYASAGHNPPWLFKKDEGDKYGIEILMSRGLRLGEQPETQEYEEKTVAFDPGNILFLYTDGLIEGKNIDGAEYGKKAARKVLEGSAEGGPDSMIINIVNAFKAHNSNKPLDDDITLAAIQMK